jgi:hypothetical protein
VVLVVGVQPATYSVEMVETLQLSQLARERERVGGRQDIFSERM